MYELMLILLVDLRGWVDLIDKVTIRWGVDILLIETFIGLVKAVIF